MAQRKAPEDTATPEPPRPVRVPMDPAAAAAEERRQLEAAQAEDDSGNAGVARVPFGAARFRLYAEQRPGFYRRWFNDVHGRIQRAKQAGYTTVLDDDGKPIRAQAGQSPEGGSLVQYLMELPMEYRNADLAAQQKSLDEVDATIYKGTHKEESGDARYVPRSTPIDIRTVRGPGVG